MSLAFVNLHGEPIDQVRMAAMAADGVQVKRRKRAASDDKSMHKGWRVTGIPPGAMEAAIESHARLVKLAAEAGGKPIKPFDRDAWLMKTRRVPIRSKPYELEQAAKDCKALAEKCGWTHIQIVEIKKVVQPT